MSECATGRGRPGLAALLAAAVLALAAPAAAPGCDGDADGSGEVDVADLVIVVLDWDCLGLPGACEGDVTLDGITDVQDLVSVILAWGPCPGSLPCDPPPEAPPNDCCDAATDVGLGTFTFNTNNATLDGPRLPLVCNEGFGFAFAPDVWFRYTPPSDGVLVASTCGDAGYDTRLAAYGGDCHSLAVRDCNDDAPGCAGFTSVMGPFAVSAGEPIWIRVGGFDDAVGTGQLTLADVAGACCVSTSCFVLTAEDCGDVGGEYQGDGTDCDGGPCTPPD